MVTCAYTYCIILPYKMIRSEKQKVGDLPNTAVLTWTHLDLDTH
jgi:hypothetical protein